MLYVISLTKILQREKLFCSVYRCGQMVVESGKSAGVHSAAKRLYVQNIMEPVLRSFREFAEDSLRPSNRLCGCRQGHGALSPKVPMALLIIALIM